MAMHRSKLPKRFTLRQSVLVIFSVGPYHSGLFKLFKARIGENEIDDMLLSGLRYRAHQQQSSLTGGADHSHLGTQWTDESNELAVF
jgi:hypothetical protein